MLSPVRVCQGKCGQAINRVRATRPKLSPSHRVHPHTTRARAATRSQSFYLRLGCCLVRESVSLVFYSETGRLFLFALFCVWWLEAFFFTRLIRRSSRRARDWFIWCWRPPEHLCRAYYCIWKTTQAKQMICSFGVTRDRSSDDLSKTPQGGDRGPFFCFGYSGYDKFEWHSTKQTLRKTNNSFFTTREFWNFDVSLSPFGYFCFVE